MSAQPREGGEEDAPPELPVRPGTSSDPDDAREIESPGDPGPTVLVPPPEEDPRSTPKLPESEPPPPGV